jgi:hypothetical protein
MVCQKCPMGKTEAGKTYEISNYAKALVVVRHLLGSYPSLRPNGCNNCIWKPQQLVG